MEPDDVVIADIAGQALDIFLHGPESAHKNGIVKTFNHTSIPIHPCTLLKKTHKQQQQNAQLTKHDAFVYWSSPCAVFWWPIFRKLGTCSSTYALSARILLTENICESVQQILQHSPAEIKKQNIKPAQLTKHDAFVYWSSSCAVCWWAIFRKLGTCSSTDALSARTLLTENICESVQQILQHSPAEKNTHKKTLNSPNMMRFFTGPLSVQCGGGRRPRSLADATQDCSTSEDFSPRTVLNKKHL